MKQKADIDDNRYLREDGGNLAAFLFLLKERNPDQFRQIRDTVTYDKVLHGSLIAKRIGLAAIRAKCPRFDAWVRRLEALAPKSA